MISLSSLYFKNEIHYKNLKSFKVETVEDYKLIRDFFNKENIRVRLRATYGGINERGALFLKVFY